MARYSGVPQSILIRRFTSQDIIEIIALEEIERQEPNSSDFYFNGIMNQIKSVFGGNREFIDYTEPKKGKEYKPQTAQERQNIYRNMAHAGTK